MSMQKPGLRNREQELSDRKKGYTSPHLVIFGDIARVTQGSNPGKTDGNGQKSQNVSPSDRNIKQNFCPVNTHDVLERVSALVIETWNYKADNPTVRHLGPMAQDFASLFGLGDDTRYIHNVDANGVALAAIQSLYQIVQEQQKQINALKTELHNLVDSVETI